MERGYEWAPEARPRTSDRILDIGSGAGASLFLLHRFGFRDVVGSDPFLPEDRELAAGLLVLKQHHGYISGEYDWITMNHVLDYVPDPRAVLGSMRRLLRPGGRVLVRMRVLGQHAWREYRTPWAKINAPRPLVLYIARAVQQQADSEGFRVERTFCDSTRFQFRGSECAAISRPHAGASATFSRGRLRAWDAQAQRLNRLAEGYQAGFVLGPPAQRGER